MERFPRYSIVIPVFNGSSTLGATLEAVQRLEGPAFEVLVADDASTDETAAVAKQYGADVVRLETNSGPATARTRGAEQARGEILIFTDDDVWVPPDMLTRFEECFTQFEPEAAQGTFSDACPYPNLISQYKNLYNRIVILRLPEWIDTTFTSVTAVKRDAFFACGGFDTNIRGASVEDRTLGRNLIRHGCRIRLLPGLEVVHNKHLSLWGLLKNQFRRSRDLARLLLRNRCETQSKQDSPEPSAPSAGSGVAEGGRFGTNAPTTMARLPAAYGAAFFLLLGWCSPFGWASVIFDLAGLLCLIAFLCFAWPITKAFTVARGWGFALATLPVNLLDAFASGAGVAWGLFSYLFLKKKY